jgi:enoyl-CoA hydratase
VAALNGHAIAGGCVLACSADRRIMARGGGRMGITELLVGVPFPALAFEIVRFAVPQRYLPEFTYSGATYDVDASLARGWVDELVDAQGVLPRKRWRGYRRRLSRKPRSSFAKRCLSELSVTEP